jgi:hypothetical protein
MGFLDKRAKKMCLTAIVTPYCAQYILGI